MSALPAPGPTRRGLILCLLTAAGCQSAAATSPQPAPRRGDAAPAASAVETPKPHDESAAKASAAPWEADPRWRARVADADAGARATIAAAASATGFAFDRGREPVLTYDAAAPADGDVVVRFVDGVRRPIVRLQPHAVLSGEFRLPDDLAPLMVRGAILAASKDREPPAWVVAGSGIVAGGAFERRLHERALGGEEIRSRESDLFAATPDDPLGAAARVKALLRIARGERPLARFVTALLDGRSEESALAEVGVSDRAFLDAAAETERARATSAIAEDPALPALAQARAALGRGDAEAADVALTPLAAAPDGGASDPWVAADVRLCQAWVSATRGETKNARASLDAAPPAQVVRARELRIVEACLAAPPERGSAVRSVLADHPDLAAAHPGDLATLVGVPQGLRAAHPEVAADVLSADPARRRAAAVVLGESKAPSAATALRLLVGDADVGVRRSALAGLAAVAGRGAADEMEAATRDADGGIRRAALAALADEDRARAAKRASEMVRDADPAVRALATELARPR